MPQPGSRDDRGILTAHLRSDGRHKDKLYVDGGPSSTGTVGHLRMEGREVFKHAVGDDHRCGRGCLRGDRLHRRRHRLVRAAPGQQANHRRLGAQAWHCAGEDRHSRSIGTAIPRRHRFRWRCRLRSTTAGSSGATWFCSKPWAAASPGAPICCGGKRRVKIACVCCARVMLSCVANV